MADTHKIITVAQQKGGAGKTTLTAHLAVALYQRGLRVALIDIDPQGSLTEWHKIREEKFGEGYTCMSFSQLSGWRLGSEISRLKRTHDVILIDSPPHTETEAKTAIRNADLVVIPVQPSPTDIWATKATVDLADAAKLKTLVVLNRLTPNSKLADLYAEQLKNLAETRLGNRVAFAASLMEGRCVTETAPASVASKEIKSLAQEIWQILGFDALRATDEANEKEEASAA